LLGGKTPRRNVIGRKMAEDQVPERKEVEEECSDKRGYAEVIG
jgi:hypothetical protein